MERENQDKKTHGMKAISSANFKPCETVQSPKEIRAQLRKEMESKKEQVWNQFVEAERKCSSKEETRRAVSIYESEYEKVIMHYKKLIRSVRK